MTAIHTVYFVQWRLEMKIITEKAIRDFALANQEQIHAVPYRVIFPKY